MTSEYASVADWVRLVPKSYAVASTLRANPLDKVSRWENPRWWPALCV